MATVVSGTWMGSPVRGLRAVRADLTDVPKDPKPTSDTTLIKDKDRNNLIFSPKRVRKRNNEGRRGHRHSRFRTGELAISRFPDRNSSMPVSHTHATSLLLVSYVKNKP